MEKSADLPQYKNIIMVYLQRNEAFPFQIHWLKAWKLEEYKCVMNQLLLKNSIFQDWKLIFSISFQHAIGNLFFLEIDFLGKLIRFNVFERPTSVAISLNCQSFY